MQKNTSMFIPLILALAIMLTAFPLLSVGKSVTTDLSISGTTATCSVSVRPEHFVSTKLLRSKRGKHTR